MKFITLCLALLISLSTNAQEAIKKVIVETYYVSDANDATDTIGGVLDIGSKTYRVFVQIQPGFLLKKIYGNSNHALKISSTENFFNNLDRGKTFAKDMSKSYYHNNTAALDSWLTIGQTTKIAAATYFGNLKALDLDGSFVGGINNDGGSAGISGGLLTNNNAQVGIPLTTADGMDTMTNVPSNWSDFGFVDLISGVDSTIFGSIKQGNEFLSYNAYLQNSGVSGVNLDSNIVLVAQLTTKGNLSFELNLEILNPSGATVKYVAVNGPDSADTKLSGWLKYPFECGCQDPNYFEFNPDLSCSDVSACHTLIVLGCMDVNACNYNPHANYNVQSLCCYPGMCADRDISLVCPSLQKKQQKMNIFPSPAVSKITIETSVDDFEDARFEIYNSFGKIEVEKKLGVVSGLVNQEIDISKLEQGIYMVRMYTGNSVTNKSFIKL